MGYSSWGCRESDVTNTHTQRYYKATMMERARELRMIIKK